MQECPVLTSAHGIPIDDKLAVQTVGPRGLMLLQVCLWVSCTCPYLTYYVHYVHLYSSSCIWIILCSLLMNDVVTMVTFLWIWLYTQHCCSMFGKTISFTHTYTLSSPLFLLYPGQCLHWRDGSFWPWEGPRACGPCQGSRYDHLMHPCTYRTMLCRSLDGCVHG